MTHEELLAEHLAYETEGSRSPPSKHVIPELEETLDIELLALQRLLDLTRFKRLMSITPEQFGELDQVERRLLLRAAEGFQKRFDEICSWMGRNTAAAPPVPKYIRETVPA